MLQYFYDNALQDGPNVKDASPEVFYEAPLLKPYVFFDVAGGREAGGGGGSRSKTNRVSQLHACDQCCTRLSFSATVWWWAPRQQ